MIIYGKMTGGSINKSKIPQSVIVYSYEPFYFETLIV